MTQRYRVTTWMLAASLVAASLLVTFFAIETARARRARLLAEGRRVALSAVTLYDVLRLTGSVEDRATLVSFVQAAVRGTNAEDELVYLQVQDAEGALIASEGNADMQAPGVLEVRANIVARDSGAATPDLAAGAVRVGLSLEPGARELFASVGLGGGAALLGAVGLALALSALVRRRVVQPAQDQLEAGREEQERLAGALSRHVGQQRARAVAAGDGARSSRVTVMVVNVAGFLPMLQRQPPPAAMGLLNELYSTTARVVHAHGGHVEKMFGDTVLCVWGVSAARPDDELRAVAAGLQLLEAVAALAAGRKQRGEEPFAVGVGIATGDAVIGTVGGRARAETVVVGEVTALALAIEQEAKVHGFGMLISEETFACVATDYQGAATPPILVRGIGMPLTLYRVRPRTGGVVTAADHTSGAAQGDATEKIARLARAETTDKIERSTLKQGDA